MVVIRLARGGSKKAPFYQFTVADSRRQKNGAFLERIGFFNPVARGQEKRLELNLERLDHWVALGAKPSDRVLALAKQARKEQAVVAE